MRCIASHLVAVLLLAGSGAAGAASAASPVEMAVFPFELMDFSAAAPTIAPDDIDREQLRLSTEEARRLIAESGRYQLVDVGPVGQGRAQGTTQGTTPVLAVAEIHYVDTSGEVIDQSADHRRRLREFEAALRSDLVASGKLANAALECPPNACSVGDINDGQLLGKAEQAGATHLLIGRFHKMSTLVQQAKFDVIDVKARKMVFYRYITFRGDNDAAWRRAESFLARQILDHGEW